MFLSEFRFRVLERRKFLQSVYLHDKKAPINDILIIITYNLFEKEKLKVKTVSDHCWLFLLGFKFSCFQNMLRKRVNLETAGMDRSRYVICLDVLQGAINAARV